MYLDKLIYRIKKRIERASVRSPFLLKKTSCLKTNRASIRAVFLNPGPGFVCIPNQTHLIQLMSSLEETPGREI